MEVNVSECHTCDKIKLKMSCLHMHNSDNTCNKTLQNAIKRKLQQNLSAPMMAIWNPAYCMCPKKLPAVAQIFMFYSIQDWEKDSVFCYIHDWKKDIENERERERKKNSMYCYIQWWETTILCAVTFRPERITTRKTFCVRRKRRKAESRVRVKRDLAPEKTTGVERQWRGGTVEGGASYSVLLSYNRTSNKPPQLLSPHS